MGGMVFKEKISKLFLCRRTLWDMSVAQWRSRYASSYLGIWWTIIPPLILALSINFVFKLVFKIDMPGYTIFALAGILPWFFLVNSLEQATNSFIASAPILRQGIFPREFIPLAYVLANLINFVISLALFLPLIIFLNFKIVFLLFLLPLVIILHFIFVFGLALFLASVNVFIRDVAHFLTTVFMIWFWVTPVFYPLGMVSSPFRWVCLLNPMTHYIILYQKLLFYGTRPTPKELLIVFLISVFSFSLGYLYFNKKQSILSKNI